MQALTIPEALWASACVQVDKLDKLPAETVIEELVKLGVTAEAAGKLVEALKVISTCVVLTTHFLLFYI